MKKKEGIISFKVDEDMMEVLKTLPNRSAFIRKAVIDALGVTCPLCDGKGMLTHNQYRHWKSFSDGHSLEQCRLCNETHLVCSFRH